MCRSRGWGDQGSRPPPPGKSQAAIGFLRLLLVWIPFQKQKATPPCADPGIFTRGWGGGGVQVNLTKKALTTFFFLVLSLFYRCQMVNFKEIIIFQGSRGGSTFSRGGVQLFPGGGGSNCLFLIETHITCDFPGGGPDPLSPLWIRTCPRYVNCVDDNKHIKNT